MAVGVRPPLLGKQQVHSSCSDGAGGVHRIALLKTYSMA